MEEEKQPERFREGDTVRVGPRSYPKQWRGRAVKIIAVDHATVASSALYDVQDIGTEERDMNFFDFEVEPIAPSAPEQPDTKERTIKINVDLDFDVETVVSNLRVSIAQALRTLADEIEEPQ